MLEQLILSDEIQSLLKDQTNIPSSPQIEAIAQSQGMITMYQDGILKCLQGITTLEEVNRVI